MTRRNNFHLKNKTVEDVEDICAGIDGEVQPATVWGRLIPVSNEVVLRGTPSAELPIETLHIQDTQLIRVRISSHGSPASPAVPGLMKAVRPGRASRVLLVYSMVKLRGGRAIAA